MQLGRYAFITKLVSNKEYKKMTQNFVSMGFVQLTNYLVPMILLPYMVRTLGLDAYGTIVFAQSLVGYLESVMMYSFSLTAVMELSQHADNTSAKSRIVSNIFGAKLILSGFSAVVILLLAFCVPGLAAIQPLLLLSLIYCIGYLFNFDWFYLGVQQMKYLTYLNLAGRLFTLAWIFLTVHSRADTQAAFLMVPLSYLLTGFLSLLALRYKHHIRIQRVPLRYALIELKKGSQIFYGQLLVRFYSADFAITMLGFIANTATVGIYALAQKVFSLFMVLTNLITVVVYPYFARLFKENKALFAMQIKRLYKATLLAFVLLSVVVYAAAPWLIYIVNGANNEQAVICLQILALALLLSPFPSLNNQIFTIHKKGKYVAIIASAAVVINMALFYPAYHAANIYGLAILHAFVYLCIVGFGAYAMSKLSVHQPQL
jgi:PST family polysaccharide transporter